MRTPRFIMFIVIILCFGSKAQLAPEIGSWILNTTQATGYAGISTNVQKLQFSSNNVYVSATCIPGYDIGPWTGNPNVPANQNFVFKITRHPVENTGSKVNTALGHIGLWTNGVSIFNAKDGMSYNNAGVWNRNALYYEGSSFDDCLGHPAPNGEYHHHVNPTCLYNDADSLHHSPVIGYAFDGFPIYGAYGFTNTNGTGPIKRLKSSYALTGATTRINGPGVNATYPAGCFVEDYLFIGGSGDLDMHNGRFCITPEYPNGIYAYFVTIDAKREPVFPYVLGPSYYGTVQPGNTGPGSGHQVISETVEIYDPTFLEEKNDLTYISCFPNPASDHLVFTASDPSSFNLVLKNSLGQLLSGERNVSTGFQMNLGQLPPGVYFVEIQNKSRTLSKKIVIAR